MTVPTRRRLARVFLVVLGLGVGLLAFVPGRSVADTVMQWLGTPIFMPAVYLEPTSTPTITPSPTATATATPSPTLTQTRVPSGLLINGGFDQRDGGSNAGTQGWTSWWAEIPKPGGNSFNYAYKPNSFNAECRSSGAAADFVFNGDCSQRVLNNWDPWWAGVYQQVAVTAGQRLRLSAYGRAWASSQAFPNPSDTNVQVRMQVGIEPNGVCNPFASTVVWSGSITPHNTWQSTSVTAQAGSAGRVCVFLSTDYRGDSRFNLASFWDSANLEPAP